jgi:hypothetical protein
MAEENEKRDYRLKEPLRLEGQRFGKLIVLERIENKHGKTQWLCQCDCGNTTKKLGVDLKREVNPSCGCALYDNLLGMKFNMLTPIEKVDRPKDKKQPYVYWKCKCDCGNEKILSSKSLILGTTLSCGCYGREATSKRFSKEKGIATENVLYSTYTYNATRRNLDFCLTREEFLEMTRCNCFYCGCEPSQVVKSRNKNNNGDTIYNGIDRLDSKLGYTKENSVPCCGTCNRIKMNMSKDEFLLWVEKVYNHLIKPKLN